MPTVKEIVKEYLQANGYDGLATDDCGCSVNDLIPCEGSAFEHCEAGHKIACCEDDPECRPWTCEGECDWHMKAGKREQP